jgi:hypothetical protein
VSKHHVLRLWEGEIALGRAFWEWAILYGSLANLVTAILAFTVLAADGSALLAVAIHFVPVPYNVLAAVGVWRSAERYRGPAAYAQLARIAIVAWAAAATLV